MLIREGDQRTARVDVGLATILAGVAGAINTAGFVAVGYYSANMTGNVSFLSEFLVTGDMMLAGMFALIVCAFIAGAFASGMMINAGRRRQIRAIYAMSLFVEGTLLLTLGLGDVLFSAFGGSAALVLGMSFAMGLQNAAATRISNARVRTTHVSGMATDIGLELSAIVDAVRGKLPREELGGNAAKLALHSSTIFAFLVGGVLGVLFYTSIGGAMLTGAGILLMAVCLPELWRARKAPQDRTGM